MIDRRLAATAAVVVALALSAPAGASTITCRKKAAATATSMYAFAAKQYAKCSAQVAGGKTCSTTVRDAKIQVRVGASRTKITVPCTGSGPAFGYASGGQMAVAVVGTATGEGRQVVDAVFGREPAALAREDLICAKGLALKAAKAGKTLVKTYSRCGSACGAKEALKVDTVFDKAEATILRKCTPTQVVALTGGDLSAYLSAVRAGAHQVVDSLTGVPFPIVSVVSPVSGAIVTPGSLPAALDVSAIVVNVPHEGYVNSIRVQGVEAELSSPGGAFVAHLSLPNPSGAEALFVEARTTFGTFATTTTVNFNLGNVAPRVVITAPQSGVIVGGGSIGVSGQVIGDLAQADVLRVGGAVTPFNPGTGLFSTSVPLSTDPVQLVEAEVQSIGLGTTNVDSVVVLVGTPLSLGVRVPDAMYNRLNNSGFATVSGLIQSLLDPAFDPSQYLGMPAAGGTLCGFSTGSKSATVAAVGANTVQANISINSFQVQVCDVDAVLGTCDASYQASNLSIVVQADLVGQLDANVTDTQVVFTGGSADLSGGIFCDFAELFAGDLETQFENEFTNVLGSELPAALNAALDGINVSGPIGNALDVDIDAVYTDIAEDSTGVSFILDSNITALSPIPDAPAITQTLLPLPTGPPVLDTQVPGTSTPYDLGFCLSDGFVNRTMAAFMLQGAFNQSLSEIPVGGLNVPLSTAVLSVVLGDPTYQSACPGCGVTLVLKPTAAAVAREPAPGEGGTVVLVVPNYAVDMVADDGGTPELLISAAVTFELPVTLDVSGGAITPTVGTLAVSNIGVTNNPAGANEAAFASGVAALFPAAAQSLGGLFGQIPLPPFQGLTLTGVDAAYNVSCAGIYMNLAP